MLLRLRHALLQRAKIVAARKLRTQHCKPGLRILTTQIEGSLWLMLLLMLLLLLHMLCLLVLLKMRRCTEKKIVVR